MCLLRERLALILQGHSFELEILSFYVVKVESAMNAVINRVCIELGLDLLLCIVYVLAKRISIRLLRLELIIERRLCMELVFGLYRLLVNIIDASCCNLRDNLNVWRRMMLIRLIKALNG